MSPKARCGLGEAGLAEAVGMRLPKRQDFRASYGIA